MDIEDISFNDLVCVRPKDLMVRWACSRSSVDRYAKKAGLTRLCLGEGKNSIVRYYLHEIVAFEKASILANLKLKKAGQ